MKNRCLPLILAIFFLSCSKQANNATSTPQSPQLLFTYYTIFKGQFYANGYDSVHFVPIVTDDLEFTARFDSSVVYSTSIASDQSDVNKLYGFSDNESSHHLFSARIGWAWYNDSLRLYGYTYNKGVRTIQELGQYTIGKDIDCCIKTDSASHSYLFIVNGVTTAMHRTAPAAKAIGYRLYPYFGGEEPAPHQVVIMIHEY